jgi:hypothetical protein
VIRPRIRDSILREVFLVSGILSAESDATKEV